MEITDEQILDPNSDGFDAAYEEALKVAKKRRQNPNKSKISTVEGHRMAIERFGEGLGVAAKNALEEHGW